MQLAGACGQRVRSPSATRQVRRARRSRSRNRSPTEISHSRYSSPMAVAARRSSTLRSISFGGVLAAEQRADGVGLQPEVVARRRGGMRLSRARLVDALRVRWCGPAGCRCLAEQAPEARPESSASSAASSTSAKASRGRPASAQHRVQGLGQRQPARSMRSRAKAARRAPARGGGSASGNRERKARRHGLVCFVAPQGAPIDPRTPTAHAQYMSMHLPRRAPPSRSCPG